MTAPARKAPGAAAPLLLLLLALLPSPARGGDVSLSAAASLREAVGSLADAFEREHPGVRIVRNFGGSGTLAKQVEAGAPCHVFISADREWMAHLEDRGKVRRGGAVTLAYNVLVFAGREGAGTSGMEDLPSLSRIALGNPAAVPAGRYATQALARSGVAKAMGGKTVHARDVREALLYAERGEVDGAFVYRTDALLSRKARILFVVPERLHDRIEYPAALTTAGESDRDAASFLALLRSPRGRAALEAAGFSAR